MRSPFWVELWFLIGGPVIWLLHYLSIYTINALHCARPRAWLGTIWISLPISSWMILICSALALSAMAWVAQRQHRRLHAGDSRRFHTRLTDSLCLLSALAVVWETLPVFLVSRCG
ncbi:hypothetical protein BOTU111922_00285 [Bordetella tumulicola]